MVMMAVVFGSLCSTLEKQSIMGNHVLMFSQLSLYRMWMVMDYLMCWLLIHRTYLQD